jgi:hypothetical protein
MNKTLSISGFTSLLWLTGLWAETPRLPTSSRVHLSDKVERVRHLTEQWIETEHLKSKEQQQVQEQLDALSQLETVLDTQMQTWKHKVASMENSMTRSDEERQDLLHQKETFEDQRQLALKVLQKIERKLMGMIPQFPDPLQKECQVPLRQLKLEKKPEQWLSRFQTCFQIIKAASAFHRRYTLNHQTIPLGDTALAVDVLYLGLTQAYFINTNGERGGIGQPTPFGWQWQEHHELIPNIQDAINMKNETSTEFHLVSLPVELAP